MPSVDPAAAGPTAQAIGNLLAGLNVDRAMAFAMAQTSEQIRALAISGVMDELSATPNGDAAVRAWYSTLPASTQTSDTVRAAHGGAIWASDPAAALQSLAGIGDPQTKMLACLALAGRSESSSPETATAAIYESGLPETGIYSPVNSIMQNWHAVNPQAAYDFLTSTQIIPPSDLPKYSSSIVHP